MIEALVIVIVAGLGVAQLLRHSRGGRQILKAADYSISEFPDHEPGKITGRLRAANSHIQAPLTGRRCALYRLLFQTDSSEYPGDFERINFCEVSESVPFWIEDNSGRALVFPEGAQVEIRFDHEETKHAGQKVDPARQQLLQTHALVDSQWIRDTRIHSSEAILVEGKRVTVYGYGFREIDREGQAHVTGYRGTTPMRLTFRMHKKHPLLLSAIDDEVDE